MINATEELTEMLLEIYSRPLCALVILKGDSDSPEVKVTLPVGYTSDQYKSFLDTLDIDYDNGYGRQWISGYVWFEDGTWLERDEYDGSEWWTYKICPPIPSELTPKD